MTRTILRLFLFAAIVGTMTAVYYLNDPARTVWCPKCVMLAVTGYKCPGCGVQRMFFHVLHGDVIAGIRYNYFAALVWVYALVLISGYIVPIKSYTKFIREHLVNRYVAYSYLILYVVWWIIRNVLDI
ncbi:MAG: DUF2752 domain-containing protein [Prevotellaceae bacterium]|nr:DUF2752 domain-containing protein [Prevotellaceae bacterium]